MGCEGCKSRPRSLEASSLKDYAQQTRCSYLGSYKDCKTRGTMGGRMYGRIWETLITRAAIVHEWRLSNLDLWMGKHGSYIIPSTKKGSEV